MATPPPNDHGRAIGLYIRCKDCEAQVAFSNDAFGNAAVVAWTGHHGIYCTNESLIFQWCDGEEESEPTPSQPSQPATKPVISTPPSGAAIRGWGVPVE